MRPGHDRSRCPQEVDRRRQPGRFQQRFMEGYFTSFARGGWTPQAQKFASSIKNGQVGGANWQAEGMLLRTSEQVDKELGDRAQ